MTSPSDMLKKHGKWIQSTDFKSKLMKTLNLSKRQVYRQIKAEVKAGRIRRVTLPDSGVLYGLPEWPLKWCPGPRDEEQHDDRGLNPAERIWIAYFKTQIPPHRGGGAARRFAEEYERLSRKDRVELLRKKSKE